MKLSDNLSALKMRLCNSLTFTTGTLRSCPGGAGNLTVTASSLIFSTGKVKQMSYIPLMIQGGLVGFMAGQTFPDQGWQFWLAIIVNAILTALYGAMKVNENL